MSHPGSLVEVVHPSHERCPSPATSPVSNSAAPDQFHVRTSGLRNKGIRASVILMMMEKTLVLKYKDK